MNKFFLNLTMSACVTPVVEAIIKQGKFYKWMEIAHNDYNKLIDGKPVFDYLFENGYPADWLYVTLQDFDRDELMARQIFLMGRPEANNAFLMFGEKEHIFYHYLVAISHKQAGELEGNDGKILRRALELYEEFDMPKDWKIGSNVRTRYCQEYNYPGAEGMRMFIERVKHPRWEDMQELNLILRSMNFCYYEYIDEYREIKQQLDKFIDGC